jgi:rhamnose utilization protein RhaD (predicted bifunctional aldolase and dehydrogenase)
MTPDRSTPSRSTPSRSERADSRLDHPRLDHPDRADSRRAHSKWAHSKWAHSRWAEIVALSHEVAAPHRDLVILAEGNTSMRTAPDRMLVKATGSAMADATADDFVEVDLIRFWALLDAEQDDGATGDDRSADNTGASDTGADDTGADDAVATLFREATIAGTGRPSVESLLHAVCYRPDGITTGGITTGGIATGGIDTVIHTHPIAVNSVLCSNQAELLVRGSLFPDQIVVLGRHPLLMPYVDPGLPLARAVQRSLREHLDRHGEPPRVIYLRNHGMFALGSSPQQALQITEMAVKVARVLLGAAAMGGPVFLSDDDAERIDTRPDEILRRRLLGDGGR